MPSALEERVGCSNKQGEKADADRTDDTSSVS